MHWTKQTILSWAVLALACGQPVKNADYDFGDGNQNGDIEQTGVVTETDNEGNGEGEGGDGNNDSGSDGEVTDSEEKFDVLEDSSGIAQRIATQGVYEVGHPTIFAIMASGCGGWIYKGPS